jgi:hypothetical protein
MVWDLQVEAVAASQAEAVAAAIATSHWLAVLSERSNTLTLRS